MVRRFSGQRIVSEIDFAPPSSMLLTEEDLSNIPDAFEQLNLRESETKSNKYGALQSGGMKLSRKFGGTLRLKQRLSSVPELLLRGIEQQKVNPTNSKTMDPKVIKNSGVSSGSMRRLMPSVMEKDEIGDRLLPKTAIRYQNFKRKASSPLSQEPIINVRKENSYIVMPVTTEIIAPSAVLGSATSTNPEDFDNRPFLKYRERNSNSDLLLDEIMNLYTNRDVSTEDSPIIKKRIDDFIDTIHESLQNHKASREKDRTHKAVDMSPIIINKSSPGYVDCLKLPNTPELSPTENLEANISTPEYVTSGGSDQSSGGEEFSDLDSLGLGFKSPVSVSDESFYSCSEEITKDINSPSTTSETSLMSRHFSIRNAGLTAINPKVLNITDMLGFSDEEVEEVTVTDSPSAEYIDISDNYSTKIVDDTTSSIYSLQSATSNQFE